MILPKKIKNIAHALLLPQKQDLVRASFNESELAVWDLLCHPAGVGGLYEIPGSGKDQDRCLDMLQALNTGHFGLSTGHGNSAGDMLSRLETMALMAADIPLAAVSCRRRELSGSLFFRNERAHPVNCAASRTGNRKP